VEACARHAKEFHRVLERNYPRIGLVNEITTEIVVDYLR